MSKNPTDVFSINGAHFELIESRSEAGKLPNIERVINTA
jgi:hypothetical protein